MDKERECIANGECRPRHQSRKSTKIWCKGREGVEHDWTWVDEYEVPGSFWFSWFSRTGHVDNRMVIRERKVCRTCGQKPYFNGRWRCKMHGVVERCDHMPSAEPRMYQMVNGVVRRIRRAPLSPHGDTR